MMSPANKALGEPKRRSTEEFASSHLVLPQTVRKQYSQKGSYFGIKPVKLPNGRLAWPPE